MTTATGGVLFLILLVIFLVVLGKTLSIVPVYFADQTRIAFALEHAANRQVVLFVPRAPDAKSGAVADVDEERVQAADAAHCLNRKQFLSRATPR